MTTDIILDKLAKLKAKAESTTNAAEAAAFMAKIRDLLVKHELSMSDIDYATVKEKDPIAQGGAVGGTTAQRRQWQERLASVVAESFFCRHLVVRGSDAIYFVGRESHRAATEYLYVRLRNELDASSKREYKRLRSRLRRNGEPLEDSHSFKGAFRDEYITTIRDRLRAEREREKLEASKTGTSLIRLKNALVETNEFVDENYKSRSSRLRSRSSSNELGRELGRQYGRNANLRSDGLKEGTSSPKKSLN